MKKKILILVLFLLVALIAGTVFWRMEHQNIETGKLTLYGNVEVRDALLAFNEQEIVSEVLVEEGDAVVAGQVLAHLRSQKLIDQFAEARAQLEAQTQIVRRLENGSRPQEVQQARAEVNAAKVKADNALANLQRQEQTVTVGASSKQSLDDARALVDVAQAQLNVNQQNLALIQEGPREEDIKAAKAQLEARRHQVALLEERLSDTTLKAPNDGIIQSRILEPGEMAGPTRPAFILATTNPKWVRAYVPETSLGLIREGMTANVTSDTWPDRNFPGQIGFISSVAEFTPQTVETKDLRTKLVYEVRVYVNDPDNELRLGMPVTVEIDNEQSGPQ